MRKSSKDLTNLAEMANEDSEFVDTPTNDIVPSFSFSGCGFLGVYHVGVAACLQEHTDVVNRPEIKFAGASAGALVATTLLCDMDFGEMTEILLQVAQAVREKANINLAAQLKDLLSSYLPEDAHIKLRNRLHISMTVVDGMEAGLVTNFKSREHLIQCLIATCFVPGFLGWVPPSIEADSFLESGNGFPHLGEREKMNNQKRQQKEQDGDRRRRKADKYESESDEKCVSHKRGEQSIRAAYNDMVEESSIDENATAGSDNRSYLQMLVQMCFKSVSTANKVARNIPVASHFVKQIVPDNLENVNELLEALVLELLSDKYLSFDGGFSDNLPVFDHNTTIVTPFAGESDICPCDFIGSNVTFDLGNTNMRASEDNIFRLSHALNPMEPKMLFKLCEEGYNQCLLYLEQKDMLSCKRHLMTRAALSCSPCNIGHPNCLCRKCEVSDHKIRSSLACFKCHDARKKALVSNLPFDVQNEFQRAINDYKRHPVIHSTWSQLMDGLWWCVHTFYASTMGLADLAIRFQRWVFRFYDNIMCLTKYTMLPLGRKRKFIRFILRTLKNSLTASISTAPCLQT